MERIMRAREPAAWALVAALGVQLVTALVWLGWRWPDVAGPYAAAEAESLLAGSVQVLGLAALVAACVLVGPTPHAPLVARLALAVIGATVGLRLLFVLLAVGRTGVPDRWPHFVAGVASLVLPALLGAGVAVLGRRARSSVRVPARAGHDETPVRPAADEQPDSLPPAPPPAPSWPVDAAAGQAWTTAGEAAAGGRGTGWSTGGAGSGWHPASEPDAADEE